MAGGVHSEPVAPFGFLRMCVGCRVRDDAATLIRVVAQSGRVVPDLARRLPGRGAHLHPSQQCLDRAERARALSRALRVEGPLDLSLLHAAVGQENGTTNDRLGHPPGSHVTGEGRRSNGPGVRG